MDCGTTLAHKFRARLRFKQYDVVLLAKVMSSFEGERMETQYHVLSYRIVQYFHDQKLATEIDESEHSDKNIDYEKKYKNEQNKNLVVNLLDLTKKNLIFLKLSIKYLDTLNKGL